jgi:hypothetical protein
MANNGKGKVIQMLSPENYIRQKARTLPVFECLVNTNWQESLIANVVVSRKHTNGNITAGLYLVDLACLGVKDTTWFFNIPMSEYRENLERFMTMEEGVDKIDYVLAHNIVHSGIEFADDYEFKPHKDFTGLTRYILDEDTDDIPLIEIECGVNGLPAYMQGPLHNDSKARQVIAHLERVAGPGNYYLMNEDGIVINSEEDDSDEEVDQFSNMSLEDKRNLFIGYQKRIDHLNDDEAKEFFELNQSIIDDLIDSDKYDEYFEAFDQELLEIEVDEDTIPDEILGVEPDGISLPLNVKEEFINLFNNLSDPKKLKRDLTAFRKHQGVEAAAAYFDLIIAEIEDKFSYSKKYNALLKSLVEKYPNYGLVRLRWAEALINNGLNEEEYTCEYIFGNRDAIHPLEYFNFLHFRSLIIMSEKNMEKTEAWKDILFEYVEEEESLAMLTGFVPIFQIELIANRLGINK